ncbi:MAG: PEP-CTERM sorting domain-containing protein [Chthoniobacterales bacterium]
MKKHILPLALSVAAVVFSPLRADAQSTYTTTNGEVNLIAGLTNLSSATAINTTNQATGISYITDSSWSTGIANLGGEADPVNPSGNPLPNNGTLAGTFGGGTYFASLNGIILIGAGSTNSAWGGWTLRLLLSDDTYSGSISYTDSDLVTNSSVTTATNSEFFQNTLASVISPGAVPTYYQTLDIADFDTGNIGIKGIEMSAMAFPFPDITYIGVTGVVPEPSTYALLALSAAGLGGYVLRRRQK